MAEEARERGRRWTLSLVEREELMTNDLVC